MRGGRWSTYLVTGRSTRHRRRPAVSTGCARLPGGTPTAPGLRVPLPPGRDRPDGRSSTTAFECVAFAIPTPRTGRPAADPTLPTFGEVWASAPFPAPVVTLDPPSRGITGLDTRISTAGPTTVVVDATIRGDTIIGTATLDHYEISVDGQAPTVARSRPLHVRDQGRPHRRDQRGLARRRDAISGPDLRAALPALDLGTATITSTRDVSRPTRSARSFVPDPDNRDAGTVSPMSLADARLFHVNVNCSDLERSRRFYTEALGLSSGARTDAGRHAAGHGVRARPGPVGCLDPARPAGLRGRRDRPAAMARTRPTGAPPASVTADRVPAPRVPRPRPRRDHRRGSPRSAARSWSEPFAHALDDGGDDPAGARRGSRTAPRSS